MPYIVDVLGSCFAAHARIPSAVYAKKDDAMVMLHPVSLWQRQVLQRRLRHRAPAPEVVHDATNSGDTGDVPSVASVLAGAGSSQGGLLPLPLAGERGDRVDHELGRMIGESDAAARGTGRAMSPAGRDTPADAHLTPYDLTSVELVVSSFRTFRDVGRFHEVLLAAPDVQAAYLRRLQHGVLQIRVEYRSMAGLPEILRNVCAPAFPFRVISHEAHRIEVALEDEVSRAEEVTHG